MFFDLSHEQTASNGGLSVFSTQILLNRKKRSTKISHDFNALQCGISRFCHTKQHQPSSNSTCFKSPERHCRSVFNRTGAFQMHQCFFLLHFILLTFVQNGAPHQVISYTFVCPFISILRCYNRLKTPCFNRCFCLVV